MKRRSIIKARIRGLPLTIRRRIGRATTYTHKWIIAARRDNQLWKVITRVPGARIDPNYDPDNVKIYDPLNICIYCGETDISKLTDEHVLAYSLGGDAILRKASCTICAEITRDIETDCAYSLFRDVRAVTGTHSRSGTPPQLPVTDRSVARPPYLPPPVFIPTRDHPGLLALPMFDPPGIVMGRSPDNVFPNGEVFHRLVAENADGKLEQIRRNVKLPAFGVWIDLDMFARLIAKTAHCMVVAEYGLSKFKPMLLETILKSENTSYFVGCATNRIPDAVGMKNSARIEVRNINGRRYVAVFLRFYAYLGTPMYTAVVGEFIPWWKRVLPNRWQ